MIYLDNSATTVPSEEVLAAFVEANRKYYANPASLHLAGKNAENLLERSRKQIASLLDAPECEIIFTSGGTEANNLAVIGLAYANHAKGSHIITTRIEHPSVLNAMVYLEKKGFEIDYLTCNKQGLISPLELKEKIRKNTILVSIMHVNNEIGTIQPIVEFAKIIKENSRAVFHSDAVQSYGRLPISLAGMGPDAITVSAHKINGLKGSGLLALRKGLVIHAVSFGGGQENGHRNGTVSVPNAAVFAKAMRLISSENKTNSYLNWRNLIINHIKKFDDVLILAEDAGAPHILAIAFPKIKGEIAVNFFQENGITLSTSSACSSKSGRASHVIEEVQLPEHFKQGVIRISFGKNNTEEEILEFNNVFNKFMKLLGRGKTNDME
ncbi:cysteine desulfurase family protein [Sporosarcina siberiensis]|uniref:Cysteine desulfurase family protein n=1 Tax=Sporosarcina siberiensis TaxID=1365606 RepID=A0ABW4SCG1_9BACL